MASAITISFRSTHNYHLSWISQLAEIWDISSTNIPSCNRILYWLLSWKMYWLHHYYMSGALSISPTTNDGVFIASWLADAFVLKISSRHLLFWTIVCYNWHRYGSLGNRLWDSYWNEGGLLRCIHWNNTCLKGREVRLGRGLWHGLSDRVARFDKSKYRMTN